MFDKFDDDKISTSEYYLEKLMDEIEAKQLELVVEAKEREINSLLEENKTLLLENKSLLNAVKEKDQKILELYNKLKNEKDQNNLILMKNNKNIERFNIESINHSHLSDIEKIAWIQKIVNDQQREIERLQEKTLQQKIQIKKKNFS